MNIASDLEGTLTTGRTWQGVGSYLAQHGRAVRYRVFFLSRMPGLLLARVGVINRQAYGNRWVADLAATLRGYSADELHHLAEWVVEREMWPNRREAVLAELERHRDGGHRIILASGTYQPIAEAFARRIGVTTVVASPLALMDGVATGRLSGPLNVKDAKVQRIRDVLGNEPLDIAYGDTVSDVPMLELSHTPVAVCPDAGLRKIASSRDWRILSA